MLRLIGYKPNIIFDICARSDTDGLKTVYLLFDICAQNNNYLCILYDPM